MRFTALLLLLLLFCSINLHAGNDKFIESFEKGKYKKSLKQCENTIKKDRKNFDAYLYKSLCLVYLHDDEKYREDNRNLIELATRNLLLINKKDKQGSFLDQRKSLVDTIISKIMAEVDSYTGDEKYPKAIKLLEDLVELNDSYLAHYKMGKIFLLQNKDREGFEEVNYAAKMIYLDYKKGKIKEPFLSEAFIELAEILSDQEAWPACYTILKRAIELFGNTDEFQDAYIDQLGKNIAGVNDYASPHINDTLLHEIIIAAGLFNNNEVFHTLKWDALDKILPSLARQENFLKLDSLINTYASDPGMDFQNLELLLTDMVASFTILKTYSAPDFFRSSAICKILLNKYTVHHAGTEEEASNKIAGKYLALGEIDKAGRLLANFKQVVKYPEKLKKLEDDFVKALLEITDEEKDQYTAWIEMYFWDILFKGNKMLTDNHYKKLVTLIIDYIDKNDFSKAGQMIKNALVLYPGDTELLLLKRKWVVADYRANYKGTNIGWNELGWTGSYETCNPGKLSNESNEKFIRRLNYFRRLAGVPDNCILLPELNERAQAAALIMGANGLLTHGPQKNLKCYTELGYQGASSSNLSLGANASYALYSQMQDAGSNNTSVGHRRWILNPSNKTFGHGSTDNSMSLVVFGKGVQHNDREITDVYTHQFVAWPPPDFVPRNLVFGRWSFSLTAANFNEVKIHMYHNNKLVPLFINKQDGGYGMNTIVWEPELPYFQRGGSETYRVVIEGVKLWKGDELMKYEYSVTIIDPD